MQAVFVFEETRGSFDIIQLRTCRQALAQLVLHAFTLAFFRLNQINPQRGGEIIGVIQLQTGQAAFI
ncbi:hypothetical protein D3C76_1217100 [compost metagenome]